VDLKEWLVIHSPRDERTATDLIVNMMKLGPQMGCHIESPDLIALQDDRTETYINALREIIEAPVSLH
jgi:aubergine